MKDLENALDMYYNHFGQNYPLCPSGTINSDEIIADIELCIDTGRVAEPLKYEDNIDY